VEALETERGLGVFRATDAFAVEAYRAAAGLRGEPLGSEIRRTAIAAGAAVVAASARERGSGAASQHLERARDALIEGRYFLYLARRFGLLDARQYRGLSLRQDSALREIEAARATPARGRAP